MIKKALIVGLICNFFAPSTVHASEDGELISVAFSIKPPYLPPIYVRKSTSIFVKAFTLGNCEPEYSFTVNNDYYNWATDYLPLNQLDFTFTSIGQHKIGVLARCKYSSKWPRSDSMTIVVEPVVGDGPIIFPSN